MEGNGRMKIFGIGLSRTGTTSLTIALRRLGYKVEHYPHDNNVNETLSDFFAGKNNNPIFQIAYRIDALLDTPVCVTYKFLDKEFPGSKFILTTRDENDWLQSMQILFQRLEQFPHGLISGLHEYLYNTKTTFDSTTLLDRYKRYVNEVTDYFANRMNDLLVWNLCDQPDWNVLCTFLNKPIPNTEFPHMNRL